MNGQPGSWRAARAAAIVGILSLAGARAIAAQAWIYPAFQQPHVVDREFAVSVAGAGYDGTSWIFQWREMLGPHDQFTLDAGAAPSVAGHSLGFTGLAYGHEFVPQHDSQPVAVLGTTGLQVAYGHGAPYTRIPFGISAGHRFDLGQGMAITPYLHPRASLEFCHHCVAQVHGGTSATFGLGGAFGVGVNFELSRRFAVRFDTDIGSSTLATQDNTIGIGVAWSPAGLRHQ
jgi:hypothetical protein